MKQHSVIIKSNAKGITLILSPTEDFKTLVEDICVKFSEAKDFFKDAELILTIEGRGVTSEELSVIVEAIELNSDIKIKLICMEDSLTDARMIAMEERFYFEDFYTNATIIPGSVKAKSTLKSDCSVVVLGDVHRGATVEAAGNVIIFGEVLGTVHAGENGDRRCYIAGNYFDAEELTIARVGGSIKKKKGIFSGIGRTTTEPVAVFIWEETLLMEPMSKGIIKQLLHT